MRLKLTIFLVCLCSLLLAGDQWGRPDDRPAWGRGRFGQGDVAAADDWLPEDIVNLQNLWLAEEGVTYGSAAPACTSWTDVIASVPAYAPAAANEPSYYEGVDGINGQPCIRGGGTDDRLAANVAVINQPWTVLCVATVPTDNGEYRYLLQPISSLTTACPMYNFINNCFTLRWTTGVNTAIDPTSRVGNAESYVVVGAGASSKFWVNGVADHPASSPGTTALSTIAMLANPSILKASDSKIGMVAVVDTIISETDRLAFIAWAKSKYGTN